MEEKFTNARKDDDEEDSPLRFKRYAGLAEDISVDCTESKFKRPLGSIKPEQALKLDVKQSHNGERCIQEALLRSQQDTDAKNPKHIRFGSLSEKHLQHCLDLIEVRTSDTLNVACRASAPCDVSMNLSSSKMEILFDRLKPIKSRRRNRSDLDSFVIECPSAARQGNVVISPVGQWIVGAITGKDNVRNFLKSPLYYHLGAQDGDVNLEKTRSIDIKGTKCSAFMSSPSEASTSSSQKLEKETVIGNQKYGKKAIHKRLISSSSTNSTCSDQSSSSACAPVSQGMLHCTWKSGIPYFVFSVDNQREFYAANLWKFKSSDDKALDYMYSFHSRTDGQKEHGTCDNVSDLVGKMKVASSFTLCSDNSKLMETEFVLFGSNENHFGEMRNSIPTPRKNKSLPKKVVDVFRTNHPSKKKSNSNFCVPSSITEDLSWEPCQDMLSKLDAPSGANLLKSHLSPNLELAAIVVRDHRHCNFQDAAVGGWGLKFLKKLRVAQANTPLEDSVSLESCQESCLRNGNACSTSMNVLVPAGFHGGPKTRDGGGPSSLTERWRSGGHCDCGGWDIGCPLTVLNNRSSEEVLPQTDDKGECKSFDLFTQGAKQGVPTLRIVNIHDGLYFIQFPSTLSALQSFSIGVAIIHTQSPILSKRCTEIEAKGIKDNSYVI